MSADPHPKDLGRLIRAAGAGDSELREAVQRLGADATARVVVTELLDRADLPAADVPLPVTVRFDLRWAGGVVPHVAELSAEPREYAAPAAAAQVVVEQDLLDAVRGVYGPDAVRRNPSRRIIWTDDTPVSAFSEVPRAAPATHRLLRGAEPDRPDLAELILRMGSDKWGLHYYTQHYDRYLAPLRDLPVVMVEIGVGGFDHAGVGGGSLHAWSRYFHRGLVYGIDVADKRDVRHPRVTTLQGDQADTGFVAQVLAETGPPDIVLDDGSHRSADVIASFELFFPHLRDGGLYFVEDLQTSYWPGFGGRSDDLNTTVTSMGRLKALVDGLNHEEIGRRAPAPTDRQIRGVHFHHNLAVVEKGSNAEGSLPPWHPARAQ
ncbi:hypothetical protein KZZ52_34330 [Dactylosporangium sp. AC04546]|uniref:class I SAM-dependent methyltransferase n=1 Tax=Dactylosporangium sp. AC04546 TaxID=2862460 RepID=UPI001EDDEC72|nr:class I SAM-dependent methyltransferase [Dactylosporangium sp. AC04546]WVK79051.1 hypothetical protein KZZ52_34330 [Dactylosporangium sp. AC04546]